jgi:hypothetical protein
MKVATRFEGTLEEVKQQLQCWRKGKRKPMRLPEKVWTTAVKLSRTHGVSQVARLLGLDYYKLKQRAANASDVADFVEVQAPGTIPAECRIELQSKQSKMILELKCLSAQELGMLAQGLWKSR